MYAFNLKAEQAFDPKKHMEKVLGHDGRRGCYDRLLGTGPDKPLSLPPRRDRDLFLLRGRRNDADPQRDDRDRTRDVCRPPARVSCTNTSTAPSVPCCSAYATAGRCPAGPRNGRATRTGNRARRISNTSGRTRSARYPGQARPGMRVRPYPESAYCVTGVPELRKGCDRWFCAASLRPRLVPP